MRSVLTMVIPAAALTTALGCAGPAETGARPGARRPRPALMAAPMNKWGLRHRQAGEGP